METQQQHHHKHCSVRPLAVLLKMPWKQTVREKLRPREFGLEYDRPKDFVRLQVGPDHFMVLWSGAWAVYHAIWLCMEAYWWSLKNYSIGYWLAYFSNICYTILACMAFVHFAAAIYVNYIRPEVNLDTMPWFLKVEWVLNNMTFAQAAFISFTYWIMLREEEIRAWTVNKHGINLLYVILIIIFTRKPVKFQHVYIPMIYAFVYIIYHCIYFFATGGQTVIYSFLNWRKNPTKAVLMSILNVFILSPLFHFLMFGIYQLKLYVVRKVRKERGAEERRNEKDEEAKAGMLNSVGKESTASS